MTTTLTGRVRATTADALLVPRRRARRDAGLLLGTAVLLAASLLALLLVPPLLARTADRALRTAVANAGEQAAVTVRTPSAGDEGPGAFALVQRQAEWLDEQPGALLPATATTSSVPLDARAGDAVFIARLVATLTPGDPADPVRWTSGRAPGAADPEAPGAPLPPFVEVGLSTAAGRALGIDPSAGPVAVQLTRRDDVDTAWVTGLYDPVDPADVRWATVPELLAPLPADPTTDAAAEVGLYVLPGGHRDLAAVLGVGRFAGTATARVDTDRLTSAGVDDLRRQVRTLLTTEPLAASGLPGVLDAFEAHAAATRAQAALVLAGTGATAACCLVLAAGLLVERRRTFLAGERARGASLTSVAYRGAVESVPAALLAGALAAGAAVALAGWSPSARGDLMWPALVAGVAVVAPAVLAARAAGSAWTGRRVPADRRERARLAGLRRGRRLLAELVAVALAVLALVALRGRGLVPALGADPDPLLTSTPFLLAVAASLAVVHVAPAVVRAATRWAARSRGLAAPLAAARAQRAATALLPLVTVTVAVALMVLCGGLVQDVRDGQSLAADRLVAADVRIDGALVRPAVAAALADLASAPGVDAVATGAQVDDRRFGQDSDLTATVLVVDAAQLARVRSAVGLPVDAGLADLGAPADGRVPVLVDPGLADRTDTSEGVLLQVLAGHVDAEVVGGTTLTSDQGAPPADARAAHAVRTADDGVVVLDAGALARVTDVLPDVTRAWVAGPGAVQAVEDAGLAELPGVTVTTRDGWYAAWSRAPLPAALTMLLLAATGALALLAVVALALVVVATSGERGRTLSTLRTLGLDARTARWATLGELAPLVVGGLVGGTVIGLALPVVLGDALGLSWVTAAPGALPVTVTWWPVLVAAGALAVALAVAVVVEQAVRRRERLGEVLRVGAR